MALAYIPVERNQLFLLPPDMSQWLPEDHLAWFVLEVVERVDTSALHAAHPNRGAGRPAYDPDMLLALLVYAYATGVRSSRRIEQLCETDVAYRVIAANHVPDHSTIARFRTEHAEHAQRLFTDVLVLCAEAGLASVGVVAVDGTKMAANASMAANRTREQIEAKVGALFAEAAATDEAEDAAHGAARGDEPPATLRGREARRARLDAAARELESQKTSSAEALRRAKVEQAAAEGKRLKGQRPAGTDMVADAEEALALEQARDLVRRERRKEAEQAAAKDGRRLPGQAPAAVHRRVRKATERLERAKQQAAESPAPKVARKQPRANTTDPDSRLMSSKKGFLQGYNAQAAANEHGVVLAAEVTQQHNDVGLLTVMMQSILANLVAIGLPGLVGLLLFDAGYWSESNATAPGPDRLIATTRSWKLKQKQREQGPVSGPPPPEATVAEQMEHRLMTEEGTRLYAKRATTIEPIFGQHKDVRGYRSFARRGLEAADAEWKLINAAHNLNKLYRATLAS
jgi:transposase